MPFGLLAAGLACWASLRLLPPGMLPVPRARLLGRVSRQVVLGGIDIAARAFNPRLPLQPGLVTYAPAQPEGAGRDLLGALASLSPGALPAGLDEQDRLVIHALDTRQDVAGDLAGTEALIHG